MDAQRQLLEALREQLKSPRGARLEVMYYTITPPQSGLFLRRIDRGDYPVTIVPSDEHIYVRLRRPYGPDSNLYLDYNDPHLLDQLQAHLDQAQWPSSR